MRTGVFVTAMLVIAATERELALLEGADTFCCGIGPVEAALQTARAIAERRPDAVLHVGIAGARGIEPPALVLGSESVYCDVLDPSSLLKRIERIDPDAALFARVRAALPEALVLPIATAGTVGAAVISWEGEPWRGEFSSPTFISRQWLVESCRGRLKPD